MASLWEEKKIFNFFRGLEYLAHRFKWPFDKNSRNFFYPFLDPPRDVFGQKTGYRCELAWFICSNIPPALLIHSWKFHVDVLKGKSLLRKTGELLGKNRPKLAQIRYTRNAKFVRTQTCWRADFSPFYQNWNFMGVCRISHQYPTNRCQVIC